MPASETKRRAFHTHNHRITAITGGLQCDPQNLKITGSQAITILACDFEICMLITNQWMVMEFWITVIHFWVDFLHFVPLLNRFFSSALSVYIGYTITLVRWSQKVAQFCEPFCGSWKSNVWQKRNFLFFLVNSLVNLYCFWDVFSKMQVFKTINFASNRWVVVQGFWSKIIDFCKSRSICLPPNSHVTKQEMTTTVCGSNLVVSKVYAPAWIAQYRIYWYSRFEWFRVLMIKLRLRTSFSHSQDPKTLNRRYSINVKTFIHVWRA